MAPDKSFGPKRSLQHMHRVRRLRKETQQMDDNEVFTLKEIGIAMQRSGQMAGAFTLLKRELEKVVRMRPPQVPVVVAGDKLPEFK